VIIPVLNSYVGNTLVYLAGAHPNACYGLHILDAIGIKSRDYCSLACV